MQRLKYIYMLLCSALSMQTMLTKQSNIKQYKQLVTHTKQSINILTKAYKVFVMQSN